MAEAKRPLVGLGVIVVKGDKVLIGQRHGSLGSGEYALPGGHLEHGETFEECAQREVLEETGLCISTPAFAAVENSVFANGAHYVTIFMKAAVPQEAEPQNLEPEKCLGWQWCDWSHLPTPMFQPLQQLVQSGYSPLP